MQQLLLSGEHSRKPLLSTTIHRMMDDLDAELRLQKQVAVNRLEYEDSEDVSIGEDASKDASEKLWVDKYRPKKYTDLMGDEVRIVPTNSPSDGRCGPNASYVCIIAC